MNAPHNPFGFPDTPRVPVEPSIRKAPEEEPSTNISDANMKEGEQPNPATTAPQDGIASGRSTRRRRKRVPMSLPTQRLEVQELPGYRYYWFREVNVPRALDAYYEFVTNDEVELNRNDIGGHPGIASGNTDLGTNVSIVSGANQFGQPERLVLMKLALEYFKEDQMDIAMRNANRIADIFSGETIISRDGEINERGQMDYTPSEGANAHTRGRPEFKPVMNRPKRSVQTQRGRRA